MFQVDAVSTSVGALFGIPSMTTYLESSAGVEAGGKTGLTVIFTGICFLLMLFFFTDCADDTDSGNSTCAYIYWNTYAWCDEKY